MHVGARPGHCPTVQKRKLRPLEFSDLEQDLASYSARPRIWPIACFCKSKSVLIYKTACFTGLLVSRSWLLPCCSGRAASLRPYNRDNLVCKAENIYWLALCGGKFAGPGAGSKGRELHWNEDPGSLRHPPSCASYLSWWGRVTSVPALSFTALGPPPSLWPDLTACPLICKVGLEDSLGWLGRFQKIRSIQRRLVEGYYHGHHTLCCHRGYGGTGVAGGGVNVSAPLGGWLWAVT